MSFQTIINNGEDYQAADITTAFEAVVTTSGVADLAAGDFQVTQNGSPDNTVLVAGGMALVPNSAYVPGGGNQRYFVVRSTGSSVTIPANGAGNPRVDRICIKVDTGATPGARGSGASSTVVVTGTAAASPTASATPSNHESLALVTVSSGFSTITNANITDDRTQMRIKTSALPGGGGILAERRVYKATATWTKPTGIKYVIVDIKAGGGGGGGVGTASGLGTSGGGGEGERATVKIPAVSLSSSVVVTIGAGGAGGVGNNAAVVTQGGVSSFGSLVTVKGGDLALGSTGSTTSRPGGDGGTGGTGADLSYPGAPGSSAEASHSGSGGGGGAGAGTNSVQNGNNARANSGAGGGGALDNGTTSRNGGNGGSGYAIVYEYY